MSGAPHLVKEAVQATLPVRRWSDIGDTKVATALVCASCFYPEFVEEAYANEDDKPSVLFGYPSENNNDSQAKDPFNTLAQRITQLYECHNATLENFIIREAKKIEVLTLDGRYMESFPVHLLNHHYFVALRHLRLRRFSQVPDFVFLFNQLKSLSITSGQVTEIPNDISQLFLLEKLDLSHNALTTLPKAIGQFKQLNELSLANNRLQHIGDLSQLFKLEKLDLANNKLATLPPTMGKLHELKELSLACNQLDYIDESISYLLRLTKVDLNFNFLLTLPEGFAREQVTLNGWANPYLQLTPTLANKLAQDYLQNKEVPNSKGYTSRQCQSFAVFLYAFCGCRHLKLKLGDHLKIPKEYNLFEKLVVFDTFLDPLSQKVDYMFVKTELIDRHITGYVQGKHFEKIRQVFPDFEFKLEAITRSDMYELIDRSQLLAHAENLPYDDTYLLQYWKTPENIREIQINWEDKGFSTLPDWLFRYTQLTKLNLNSNRLREIPDDLQKFEQLEELDLGYNLLKTFPKVIFKLKQLKKLNLSVNRLNELPSLENLPHLVELKLNHNQLEQLPTQGWEKLQSLATLDLTANLLTTLPKELAQLPALQHCDVRYNRLAELPAWLVEKEVLDSLDVLYNYCDVPDFLKEATIRYLQRLQKQEKSTFRLENTLTNLFCLAHFNTDADLRAASMAVLKVWLNKEAYEALAGFVYHKSVDYVQLLLFLRKVKAVWGGNLLWEGITAWLPRLQLKMTKRVLLGNQGLAGLPSFYLKPWQNNWVDLSHNHLRRLPQTLSHLNEIRRLDLSHNGLKVLQKEALKPLANVRNFNLATNLLEQVPPALFNALHYLANLDLSHNHLDHLPYIAEGNTRLKRLDLSLNNFGQISAELVKLEGLQYLNLSYNHLGKQSQIDALPLEISYMDKLTHIDLSYNFLSQLPPGIGLCEKLQWLNLSQNNFEELPVGLYDSLTLEMLDLSHNYFKQLPDDIAVIETLQKLILTGNPLPHEEIARVKKLLPNTEVIFAESVTSAPQKPTRKIYEPMPATELLYKHAKIFAEDQQFGKAIKHYKKAALLGDLASMYALGKLYKNQQKDLQGIYWLRKAVYQGAAEAQQPLAELYRVRDELGKARYWYDQKLGQGGDRERM